MSVPHVLAIGAAVVIQEPTFVDSILLTAGGAAAASLVLNDSLDGSGDDIKTLKAATGLSQSHVVPGGVYFKIGVYATLSGALSTATITTL